MSSTKRLTATSKIKICEAALAGIVRPEYRVIGQWLLDNQIHQISYHRQKVHSLKTRLGGNEAFAETLKAIGSAAVPPPVACSSSGGEVGEVGDEIDFTAALGGGEHWECVAYQNPPAQQLTKEHQELVSYVLNVGMEMESKCAQILEAASIWNDWCEENLLYGQDPAPAPSAMTALRFALAHQKEGGDREGVIRLMRDVEVGGWKILSADRKRQRYTKKTVQRWISYMAERGRWREDLTVSELRDALEDGGVFCSMTPKSPPPPPAATQDGEERLAQASNGGVANYKILGGRRNHFTTVDSMMVGEYSQAYNFRRYDTDLILPQFIVKYPLPRVVVFECTEINLKAVMFIARKIGHPVAVPKSVAEVGSDASTQASTETPPQTSVQSLPELPPVPSTALEEGDHLITQFKRELVEEEEEFASGEKRRREDVRDDLLMSAALHSVVEWSNTLIKESEDAPPTVSAKDDAAWLNSVLFTNESLFQSDAATRYDERDYGVLADQEDTYPARKRHRHLIGTL